MAIFIYSIKEKLIQKYRVIRKNIINKSTLKPSMKIILNWIIDLKPKEYFPVFVGLALLSAAGLAWAGETVPVRGGPAGKAPVAAGFRDGQHTGNGGDNTIPGESVNTGHRGDLPGHKGMAGPGSAVPAVDTHRTAVQASRGGLNHGDLYLMARVIEGEAADEPLEGKVAVGAVIVNRMESGKFPGSVRQVVYQPLAFEAVANGHYNRPLTRESVKAAELALEGRDPTGGALYYWNPETARSTWVWQRPIIKKIGRHVFAR